MKIAVPTRGDQFTPHFGRCDKFAIINVEDNHIVKEEYIIPPKHQPGVLPVFLATQGVKLIIAGGMGISALNIFKKNQIKVITGVSSGSPRILVEAYLQNQLKTGNNLCDH